MLSITIFKQTLKANWKLWAIFTGITAIMGAVVISVYDPKMMQGIMDMFKDMPGMSDLISNFTNTTSLLGMLGSSFYSMQGVIIPLIFVIMTGNSLIASQVDRGSMAYTLSTPIKRTKVVTTQAIYLITSVFAMFAVVTIIGLAAVQLAHNGLWGQTYTADVKAVADVLGKDKSEIADNLNLISGDKNAVREGAKARGIDEDVYTTYLSLKQLQNAGMDTSSASQLGQNPEQIKQMEDKLVAGVTAAAEALNIELSDLMNDMGKIKSNAAAMNAATSASGLPEQAILGVINAQLAAAELSLDHGLDFNVVDYINLNLGIFLLMFAIAGISFMFSCIFNLTKNSLALGAGIPIAFLVLQIMSQASSSLEGLKYVSLNTLFSPSDITGGGTFVPQFIVLAALGVVLYGVGITVFKRKDLPL